MAKDSWWSGNVTSTAGTVGPSCYKSHKPLELVPAQGPMQGSVLFIHGGSCHAPVVKDADVYIGLDAHMTRGLASPWNGGQEIEFPITDMQPPKNAAEFKKLVAWVCNQLQEGKKVHAGCIGGHGRTGTFLSAVVAELTGNKDAVQYVREKYCPKAVESTSQIKFLMEHFGVSTADPTKSFAPAGGKSYKTKGGGDLFTNGPDDYSYGGNPLPDYSDKIVEYAFGKKGSKGGKSSSIQPAKSSKSIWGAA